MGTRARRGQVPPQAVPLEGGDSPPLQRNPGTVPQCANRTEIILSPKCSMTDGDSPPRNHPRSGLLEEECLTRRVSGCVDVKKCC